MKKEICRGVDLVRPTQKKEKGITLIALVITIIVLLILAGVSLKLIAGGEGIIGKAEKATQKYSEEAAKEKLLLAIAELQVEVISNENRNIILEDFLKMENEQINVEKNDDGTILKNTDENNQEYAEVTIDGYSFKVYPDGNVVANGIQEIQEKLSIEYKIKETSADESTIKLEITFKSNTGISQIIYPNNEPAQDGDGKNNITIEYEVNSGVDYIFKVIGMKETELEKTINAVPVYDIATIEDLENIRIMGLNKNYQLVNSLDFKDRNSYETEERYNYYNIDANGDGKPDNSWTPIGGNNDVRFTGSLDGHYHKISNLYKNSNFYGGLLGEVGTGCTIKRLLLDNVNSFGSSAPAGLIGQVFDSVTIDSVGVTGTISYTSNSGIGGFIGEVAVSTCAIVINRCFADVTTIGSGYNGLLVGKMPWAGEGTKISDTYAIGTVERATPCMVAEWITNISMERCYSGCNIMIRDRGIPNTCYVESTMPTEQSGFTGWDFENTWYMDLAVGRPRLQWEKLIK